MGCFSRHLHSPWLIGLPVTNFGTVLCEISAFIPLIKRHMMREIDLVVGVTSKQIDGITLKPTKICPSARCGNCPFYE